MTMGTGGAVAGPKMVAPSISLGTFCVPVSVSVQVDYEMQHLTVGGRRMPGHGYDLLCL